MKSFFQLGALVTLLLLGVGSARADDFSLVPMGDASYKQLSVLGPLGWTELRSVPKASLTRYEIATETARAIDALRKLRSSTRFYSPTPAMRPGIRAVRDLTEKYRPELRGMGIDATEAIHFCDELIKGSDVRGSELGKSDSGTSEPGRSESGSSAGVSLTGQPISSPRRESKLRTSMSGSVIGGETRLALPLSSRLRFESMVTKLSRDAADPFGDTNDLTSPNSSRAGVALSLNNVVAMHAFGGRSSVARRGALAALSDPGRSLNAPVSAFASSGAGVSVTLPRGVQLQGNYERLSALGGGADWNRVGGEVEMSAWRNRLSLRANWSRLLPIDARLLPSSASGLDVGLDVSERLRLTLLYRQMYSDSAETTASRVVSGGININF